MKILLLLGSILALLVLGGCTKEEEAAKPVTPPAGVTQGTESGGPKVQARPPSAVSNQ
ncbi:MAG: hypothetical protein QM758_19105 [Armatimonas sp.]